MAAGGVSAGSERSRFGGCCCVGEVNRGFGTKFLDLFQTQINNLDPTTDQPPTAGKCIVRGTRGQVQRCECCGTQFGAADNTFYRPGTGNTSRSDIEHGLGHGGHDPVLLPLVESVPTIKVGFQIKPHHPRDSFRHDLVTIRHPLGPIPATKKRHPSGKHRILHHPHRQREIPHPHPSVTEILPRPRPIRSETSHGLEAIPGALNKVSRPVYNGFAAVAVLLHRCTPGHHLPGLHERIRRNTLHRGQLYPIQQPIDRIRTTSGRGGESLHHPRIPAEQLVVAVHHLLMIPPLVPILRQRGATECGSLRLKTLKFGFDGFYRTREIIQRASGFLKLRLDRFRCRRRRSHQPISLLRFRSHIHPG